LVGAQRDDFRDALRVDRRRLEGVRDQLVALAKLAEMDASTRDLDRELKSIPARIEEMRADVQTLETLLAQERRQLDEAKKLETLQADELRQRGDALTRARVKVGKATNMREADAAEREVDSVRQLMRDREAELERIRGTIEAKSASLAAREKTFEEAKAAFAEDEKQARARLEELNAEKSKVLAGREELAERSGKTLMKRYDRLRTQKEVAVAIIETNTCSGCRMAFPAQLYIEMQKAESFLDCPMCRRIVIHKVLLE
jgi:predicted  nucleic acid-binding Zn-ribbon protein